MDSSILEFEHVHCLKKGFQFKVKNRMASNVDPDEMAHHEPSHLDLHCLHKFLSWSAWLKG